MSLGLEVSSRELVFYTVRGLKGKFSRVRKILKMQQDKSMDGILEILREEETTSKSQDSKQLEGTSVEVFLSRKNKNTKTCYFCRKPGHIAKLL